MSNRPRTIHLQKALDKIKKENINTGVSSEYLLLLEQMSILTDINEAYGEQIGGINEVIAEMEQSRKLLEQKFDQHLESGKELSSMMRDIHERIMNPDDGLIVKSREIQNRVDALERTKEIVEQETKEKRTQEMEEQKESAREKRDRSIKIMYIISISVMALLVFGKEVAIPPNKILVNDHLKRGNMKEKLFQVGLYVKESQFRKYILNSSLDILRYNMKLRIEDVIRAYESLDESDASVEALMDMIERMREDLVVSSMQLEENINSFNLFKENTKNNSDDNTTELLLENETEE